MKVVHLQGFLRLYTACILREITLEMDQFPNPCTPGLFTYINKASVQLGHLRPIVSAGNIIILIKDIEKGILCPFMGGFFCIVCVLCIKGAMQ